MPPPVPMLTLRNYLKRFRRVRRQGLKLEARTRSEEPTNVSKSEFLLRLIQPLDSYLLLGTQAAATMGPCRSCQIKERSPSTTSFPQTQKMKSRSPLVTSNPRSPSLPFLGVEFILLTVRDYSSRDDRPSSSNKKTSKQSPPDDPQEEKPVSASRQKSTKSLSASRKSQPATPEVDDQSADSADESQNSAVVTKKKNRSAAKQKRFDALMKALSNLSGAR